MHKRMSWKVITIISAGVAILAGLVIKFKGRILKIFRKTISRV